MTIEKITAYSGRLHDAVNRLLPQLDPNVATPSEEFLREILGSEGITLLTAEEEGEIAGMLTLARYPNITGMKFWIEDVVVDENFRGKSIGEKIIIAALEHARYLGAKEVKLTSRPFREAANRLYQKAGFERVETNVYKYRLQ